jgi:26S proteasome regulatory subunit T1
MAEKEGKKEVKKEAKKEDEKDKAKPLDESDISLLKRYGRGPYFEQIKKTEEELKDYTGKISKLCGVKESDTGLAPPGDWFLTVREGGREVAR